MEYEPQYAISEISFDESRIKLRIVDLTSGKCCNLYVNQQQALSEMLDNFKCAKDVLVIGQLQMMEIL